MGLLALLLRDAPPADFRGGAALKDDCPSATWRSILGGWFRHLPEAPVPLRLAPALVSAPSPPREGRKKWILFFGSISYIRLLTGARVAPATVLTFIAPLSCCYCCCCSLMRLG